MTTYPTSFQDLDATRGTASDTLSQPSHVAQHTLEDGTIEAIQTKLGIDSSADTASIDYKLKNTSSVNPGHKHTLAGALTDVEITSPADGSGLFYDTASGKWKDGSANVADASATVKGVTKLSTSPVSTSDPIAVGDNDTRVPTQGENDALVGTSGTPSTSNKYVTSSDESRMYGIVGYAADAGANDTYVITLSPVPTAYTAGMKISFKANTANTGACTINVNSLGAKTIKKDYNTDLITGEILAGQIITLVYDGTNFQLQSKTDVPKQIASGTLSLTSATTNTLSPGFQARYIRVTAIGGLVSSLASSSGSFDGTTNKYIGMTTNGLENGTGYCFVVGTTNNAYYMKGYINNVTSTSFDLVTEFNAQPNPTKIFWEAFE